MVVTVVEVRIVRMAVAQATVLMVMAVRFAPVPSGCVLMPVVLVVDVLMTMHEVFVHMRVFVLLGKVEPDARGHQPRGDPECGRRRFGQQEQCQGRAKERSYCEVRARAGGTEVA